ncbi:MAG TPA: cold-shock protein [Burkholderiales bacterium]|nr:cold-shock protein [Burkholderiales bacterium]
MAAGMVKWFNNAKGIGFISPDDGGKDLFVDLSPVPAGGFKTLKDGERVDFVVTPGAKGPQATEIRIAS